MKAWLTSEEYRKIYFIYGSINSVPDKIQVDIKVSDYEVMKRAKILVERWEVKKCKKNHRIKK